MSAVFSWEQTVGAEGTSKQDLGSTGNLVNFKNIDSLGTSDYAQYPIPAGNNSYELWLRGHFAGVFTAIYDVRFWMSQNFASPTGLSIYAKTTQAGYSTPTNASSSYATAVVGTSDPGTANVSSSGSLSSSITSSVNGYTDYIVLQLRTTNQAAAGDTDLCTVSMSYIEQ